MSVCSDRQLGLCTQAVLLEESEGLDEVAVKMDAEPAAAEIQGTESWIDRHNEKLQCQQNMKSGIVNQNKHITSVLEAMQQVCCLVAAATVPVCFCY